MLHLFCCENRQIILPNVVSWRVTVTVGVHILGLPSVGHPADASAAVEDWRSNVVVVKLMDDDHDTIFTTYLPLPGVVERAEVIHRGRVRRLLLVDVLFII
jgi:hypothetical protein